MVRNQIAQLAQERELTTPWLVGGCFLHGLPCGRSPLRKPTSFSPLINPVRRLCFELSTWRKLKRLV
jgi:hypothetical protein